MLAAQRKPEMNDNFLVIGAVCVGAYMLFGRRPNVSGQTQTTRAQQYFARQNQSPALAGQVGAYERNDRKLWAGVGTLFGAAGRYANSQSGSSSSGGSSDYTPYADDSSERWQSRSSDDGVSFNPSPSYGGGTYDAESQYQGVGGNI